MKNLNKKYINLCQFAINYNNGIYSKNELKTYIADYVYEYVIGNINETQNILFKNNKEYTNVR